MKPLYELVTAAELGVGDWFATMRGPSVVIAEERVNVIESCTLPMVRVNVTRTLLASELVFRRIPATEDQRVLRRALETLAKQVGYDDPAEVAESCIEDARQELEIESTS